MRTLDVSNYGTFPTKDILRAICLSQDIGGIIIACEFPETFKEWYAIAKEIPELTRIEAYIELYPNSAFSLQTRAALDTISGTDTGRLWLAFENGIPPADSIAQLRTCVEQVCGSYPSGIYTAEWYWLQYQLSGMLGDIAPLWHAAYPANAEAGVPAGRLLPEAYGGWLNAKGWQYQGNFSSYGVQMDLSQWG